MNPNLLLAFVFSFGAGATIKAMIALLAALGAAAVFGTTITAQTPGSLVASSSPDADTVLGQGTNLPTQFEVLTGTTDVITGGGGQLQLAPGGAQTSTPIVGTSFIETAGVDATTLATPVAGPPSAGGNDGLEICIVDNGGHAHTVTTASNVITPSHHVATFNGTKGSFVTFIARNGNWIPLGSSGVTFS